MARVNHKKVRQLLNEQRSKISDRQFFTSRILALHFEDMAMAQTRRYQYNRRIHVGLFWDPKSSSVANTNNLRIRINTGNQLVTQNRSRENRYRIICGLFAHELGHCLYTDFPASQTHKNYLEVGKWYPDPPELKMPGDIRNERRLWEYGKSDPQNMEMLRWIAHIISNILEDGYVENRMLSRFPGKLGACLQDLRNQQWESLPTVTQLMEKEESDGHIFESILQLLLSYAKYGELKYGETPLSDERIQTVFGLLTEIDSAVMEPLGKNRLRTVNLILVRCWEYLQDYLELCKARQKEAEASGASSALGEILCRRFLLFPGSSEAGEGSSPPVEEEASFPLPTAEKREETAKQAEEIESSANAEMEENSTDRAEENSKGDESLSASVFREASSRKQKVSSKEGGRIPLVNTERVSEPLGGEITRDDSYERERYDGAAADIERVLEQIAEKAACKQLENERLRELNDAAQGISYGNIHEGVSICVKRIAEVDEELIEQYNTISAPLLTISRQLQKSLVQLLKDRQRGGKQTSLPMGRRLEAHALYRNDGKVFYKNALPNELPELAVGLLLDESGSMRSSDRCTYARASAVILYDFCQSLHIPVMVYGHSTESSNVALYSYAEFDSIDGNDKYRLMDISARNDNRDGAALRYVAEQLFKRQEEVKLLILVSDGQPAADGYYGSAAEEDLRGIKQEYRRKGILFVAAAIGDDKANIERIYGDSYLDITDLNQLPVKLTTIVKRHIKA